MSQIDFQMGVMRLEKRSLFTFASKLYQEEELRLRGMVSKNEAFVPDWGLKQAVAAAIDDPELMLADAKSLLRQMKAKVEDMETRLTDYEDTAQQISPSQLPQTKSKPTDLWTRFRRCVPSFMDVVLDSGAVINDIQYLTMSDDVQKRLIKDLNSEIDHKRNIENRYEKIVDQLAKANEEDQKKMTQGTITVINKNLLKQRNDK